MPASAITDHGNRCTAPCTSEKAKKAGVKPIIGSEVYIVSGSRHEKTRASEDSFHLILLVKDREGYQNLCRLISSATWRDSTTARASTSSCFAGTPAA